MIRVIKQTTNNFLLATLLTLTPITFLNQTTVKAENGVKDTVDSTVKSAEKTVKAAQNSVNSTTRGNSDNTPAAENRNPNADLAKATANEKKFGASQYEEVGPLTGKHMDNCQAAKPQISSAIDRITTRGEKQLEVFNLISRRTQEFYATKGYDVAGYDQFVSELGSLYDSALTSLTATQNAGDAWDCRSDEPLGQMIAFQQDKQAEREALQAYKQKVQELIMLVKNAAKETK